MKRVIGISTFVYDIIGNRTLYLSADTQEKMNAGSRRVTRTKTLDGGAVAYDAGYAAADITFTIAIEAKDSSVGSWIARLVQTYNLIRISTLYGVFSAVPHQWRTEDGKVILEALVMEKLT